MSLGLTHKSVFVVRFKITFIRRGELRFVEEKDVFELNGRRVKGKAKQSFNNLVSSFYGSLQLHLGYRSVK